MDINIDVITSIRVLLTNRSHVLNSDKRNIYKLMRGRSNWDFDLLGLHGNLYKDIMQEIFSLAGKGITERELVINHLREHFYQYIPDDIDKLINEFKEINKSEIEQFRALYEIELEALQIKEKLTRTEELITLIQTSVGEERAKYIEEYKRLNMELTAEIRNIERASGTINSLFLTGSALNDLIHESHDLMNDTAHVLSTGSKYLDMVLNGGLKGGEFTVFSSGAGHGKSLMLLNMAMGILESNDKIVLKNEDKIPFVSYISFENRPTLTFNRIAKYALGYSSDEIKEMDVNELKKEVVDYFDSRKIKLKMDYRVAYTLAPEDIHQLIEGQRDELGNEYECIAVFIDYLFLLKLENIDYRLALSKAARKLADIAILENIPVISATQTNADIEIAPTLTQRQFGESKAIINHCDNVIMFRRESVVSPTPYSHPLLGDKEVNKLEFFEMYSIKERNNENATKDRKIVPLCIDNTFKVAKEHSNSTFALEPLERLNVVLDTKYKIGKKDKDKNSKPHGAGAKEEVQQMLELEVPEDPYA